MGIEIQRQGRHPKQKEGAGFYLGMAGDRHRNTVESMGQYGCDLRDCYVKSFLQDLNISLCRKTP